MHFKDTLKKNTFNKTYWCVKKRESAFSVIFMTDYKSQRRGTGLDPAGDQVRTVLKSIFPVNLQRLTQERYI